MQKNYYWFTVKRYCVFISLLSVFWLSTPGGAPLHENKSINELRQHAHRPVGFCMQTNIHMFYSGSTTTTVVFAKTRCMHRHMHLQAHTHKCTALWVIVLRFVLWHPLIPKWEISCTVNCGTLVSFVHKTSEKHNHMWFSLNSFLYIELFQFKEQHVVTFKGLFQVVLDVLIHPMFLWHVFSPYCF